MANKLRQLFLQKQRLDSFKPLLGLIIKNLDDWFRIELTYTSNAIEGNTLSRIETSLVVQEGITIEGKTIREHQEAINHALALDYIRSVSRKKKAKITESDILNIHRLILSKIDDVNAGRYRRTGVRIAGSRMTLPNYQKIPDLIKGFFDWLNNEKTGNPVKMAADAHFKFVSIHPFVDGNGRCGRLLMNLILIKSGFPPAIIRKEDRKEYIGAIEKGQLTGDMNDYYEIIYKAVDRSFEIYFQILDEKKKQVRKDDKLLLKIGQLAKITKETVPTIRFWTNQGLLKVKEFSQGGYQLFDKSMVKRVEKIRNLQKKERLTIEEIKRRLEK